MPTTKEIKKARDLVEPITNKAIKVELKSYGDFENINTNESMLAEKILKNQVKEVLKGFIKRRKEFKKK